MNPVQWRGVGSRREGPIHSMCMAISILGGLSIYFGLCVAAADIPLRFQGMGWKAVGLGGVAMVGGHVAGVL